MSDEIAEFLRRAAQRRAEQMQQQMEQQRRLVQPQQQQQPQQQSRPLPSVIEAEIVDDDDEPVQLRPVFASFPQRGQSLKSPDIARQAEQLADAAEQADERLVSHLQHSFQGAGRQMRTDSIEAAVLPTIDNEMLQRVVVNHPILQLLRDPQSVRNAIVVSELFNRPVQNW
jgi:hypothetical protein